MRLTFALPLVLIAVASGCAGPSGTAEGSRSPSRIVLTASWAKGYASLADLRSDADMVVVGDIKAIAYQGRDPQDESLPLTRYTLFVHQVLWGTAPVEVTIAQTGGVIDGVTEVVEGDPLMAAGERYLLYLKRVNTGPALGQYGVVGGPQGRFLVHQDGSLSKVGDTGVELAAGMTVAAVQSTNGR